MGRRTGQIVTMILRRRSWADATHIWWVSGQDRGPNCLHSVATQQDGVGWGQTRSKMWSGIQMGRLRSHISFLLFLSLFFLLCYRAVGIRGRGHPPSGLCCYFYLFECGLIGPSGMSCTSTVGGCLRWFAGSSGNNSSGCKLAMAGFDAVLEEESTI